MDRDKYPGSAEQLNQTGIKRYFWLRGLKVVGGNEEGALALEPIPLPSEREYSPEDWRGGAACADPISVNPEWFYSLSSAKIDKAKSVCARCAVKSYCLGYALAKREQEGVWGGFDEEERERLEG